MGEFVYVVSLRGDCVYGRHSIQCVIKSISDLDKVRKMIKTNHDVEFEKSPSKFYNGWWKFENITDSRDMSLIIERIDII